MKSARLEWCLGDLEVAAQMLDEGCAKYPLEPKLHMMRGQLAELLANQRPEEHEKFLEQARDAFREGVRSILTLLGRGKVACLPSTIRFEFYETISQVI